MKLTQFQILLEHNVVNVPEIDAFVSQFTTRTVPPEGQRWFRKKLRGWIINSAPHLARMTPDEVLRTPGLPDFAITAAQAGEEVYNFDLQNPAVQHLRGQMEHICDFFNALQDVATREAANDVDQQDAVESRKLLSKLSRIEPDQMHQISEDWYRQIGKRQSQEKDGVKVVMRFSDGYYVVEYGGSKAVYTLDGNHLQNCMRGGNYWKDVLNGTMKVYGIRRPSDEAVVGIRLTGNTLSEVKGKQNEPPVEQYHPYVVGFLNALKPQGGQISDLTNCDIYYHNGRYGTFEDVAEKLAETPLCRVFRVAQKLFFKTATRSYQGSLEGDRLDTMPLWDLIPSGKQMLALLNAMGLAPTGGFAKALMSTHAIVWSSDSGYGWLSKTGRKIFSFSAFDVWMSDLIDGSGVALFYESGKRDGDIPPIDITNNQITTIPRLVINMLGRDSLIALLTAIGLPPVGSSVTQLEHAGVYWDGGTYRRLQDIGKPLGQGKGWILYSINNRNRFAVDDLTRTGATNFTISKGKVTLENSGNDGAFEAVRQSLLVLRSKLKLTKLDRVPPGAGFSNFRGTILLELDDVVKLLGDAPVPEYFEYSLSDGEQGDLQSFLSACRKRGEAQGNPKLQKQIFDLVAIKTEPYRLNRVSEHRVFDLVIPEYQIEYPAMFRHFIGILDDKLIARLGAQFTKALVALTRNIEKNPMAKYNLGEWQNGWRSAMPKSVGVAFNNLLGARYASDDKVHAEMRERQANKDKYATTVSSRFAALNAARKLKG